MECRNESLGNGGCHLVDRMRELRHCYVVRRLLNYQADTSRHWNRISVNESVSQIDEFHESEKKADDELL
jgi:hypothetical protein